MIKYTDGNKPFYTSLADETQSVRNILPTTHDDRNERLSVPRLGCRGVSIGFGMVNMGHSLLPMCIFLPSQAPVKTFGGSEQQSYAVFVRDVNRSFGADYNLIRTVQNTPTAT